MEVVVALFAITVILGTIVIGIGHQQRFGRQSLHRTIANVLARNETEALRAAGPANASAYVGSRTVDSSGLPSPDGPYTIIVSAQTICAGGESLSEDPNIIVTSPSCSGRNAVLNYRVDVVYPTGRRSDTISYELRVSERGRFGDARPIP